jgi:hypothetical protein
MINKSINTLLVPFYRQARSAYRRFQRQNVFEQIYRDNLWGGSESRSGPGSGLAATENLRSGLLDTIKRFDVHTMIDAPCGDFAWMSALNLTQHLEYYIGYDIVPQVISENKKLRAAKNISFELADLVKRIPPKSDLILCRHLLIHLPFKDGIRVLRNFKSSGSRLLMITNQPQVERNNEILYTGSFRPINLYLPPFSFPQPIWSVDDSEGKGDGSEAALFELAELDI